VLPSFYFLNFSSGTTMSTSGHLTGLEPVQSRAETRVAVAAMMYPQRKPTLEQILNFFQEIHPSPVTLGEKALNYTRQISSILFE